MLKKPPIITQCYIIFKLEQLMQLEREPLLIQYLYCLQCKISFGVGLLQLIHIPPGSYTMCYTPVSFRYIM